MKQNLEQFIRSNKDAFDDKQPSERVWAKIDSVLFKPQGLWNSLIVWRAAAVIFMAISMYLLIPAFSQKHESKAVLSEFKDVERFYYTQIAEKVEMIENISGDETGMNGFTQDFTQLEAMYEVLRDEMRTRPSEKVKDALILNLLIRIDLLNQQLHKIESGSAQESENKEKSVAI